MTITILTFCGHVTLSVTWSLDSQHAVFYKWFSDITPLSRIVAQILRVKHLTTPIITIENAVITILG